MHKNAEYPVTTRLPREEAIIGIMQFVVKVLRQVYYKTEKQVLAHCSPSAVLKLLYSFCLFFWLSPLIGQHNNLSSPFVANFSKTAYSGGSQNFNIQQARNGMMYFANNEGLLTFDGTDWELFPLPNKTRVRSIYLVEDRIYTGGQGEIGYFQPNQHGILNYHSLVDKLDANNRQFSDVWDIFFIDGIEYFRTEKEIYKIDGGSVSKLTSPATISFTVVYQDTIYAMLRDLGLYRVEQERFVPIVEEIQFQQDQLITQATNDKGLFILSQKEGIWQLKRDKLIRWTTLADEYFQEHRIRSAAFLKNGLLAIGTETGGVVLLDKSGRPMQIINKDNGLQNNFILSIKEDRRGQIWLGLDNGISQLLTSQDFGSIVPDGNLEGKAFAACLFKGHLYLGTTNGLYVKPWLPYYTPLKDLSFELIPGTEGQVWGLNVVGDNLWLAHNNGAILIEGKMAWNIWDKRGTWKYVPMQNKIIVGTYQGIITLEEKNGNWIANSFVDEFNESSRILEVASSNEIWISHPYRGVFKISFDNQLENILSLNKYGAEKGVSLELNNYIFSIYNNFLIGTESGILKYNKDKDSFEPFNEYSEYLESDSWIQRLYEDRKGNIWYVKNNIPGLLRITDVGLDKKVEQIEFSDLKQDLVGGFELIYPLDNNNTFIGTEKGFVHLDPSKTSLTDTAAEVAIYHVTINDSLVYSNKYHTAFSNNDEAYSFSSSSETAYFNFGSINLLPSNKISYRHQLKGTRAGWSNWNNKREKEFTNLSHGSYEFMVQAKDEKGNISSTAKYLFEIEAPWYASTMAKVFYTLLFLLALSGLILVPRSRFEKEKAQMETAYNSEIEKTQAELIILQNEKLESDLKFKNKELASATMHWAQKGEMLRGIKNHLDKIISDKPDNSLVFKSLRALVRSIERDTQLDDSWDQFSKHFDEVHSNFLKRLREAHPAISNNDLKLCAYLKMNLSTKEIAPLLNISIRGVEASRYRLRKKMNLSKEVNLTDYIIGF